MPLLPKAPLDEGVELESYAPKEMHCDDLLDRTDCEDDCPCVPGMAEPPLDRT